MASPVTTFSPSSRPERISAVTLSLRPTSTRRRSTVPSGLRTRT